MSGPITTWSYLARRSVLVSTLALTIGFSGAQALAQEEAQPTQSPLPLVGSGLVESLRPISTPSYRADYVYLDGRPLFLVTVPIAEDQPQSGSPVLLQRIRSIQNNLRQILDEGVDPAGPNVEIRTDSGSPVIYVGDSYLMTVTQLDAEAAGMEPLQRAWTIRRQVREGLIAYYQERQLSFLLRQGVIAGGIVLGVFAISWVLGRWERRILSQREICTTQLALPRDTGNSTLIEPDPEETQQARRQEIWLDIQHRLIQMGQVLLWGGGLLTILGLFPQTRWLYALHTVFIRGRLLGLGIVGVSGYVGIKLTHLAIHSFFVSIRRGKWLSSLQQGSENPRLIKRLDTLEGVVKGTDSVAIILTCSLIAVGMMGVNIGPVLTSLGFIGLGISLAAQDLIKDLINGMMILLEDQFAEGDVIVIDGRGGLVEHINLRITQLRNTEGSLITIPNNTIRVVENLSNGWSRVDLMIQVAFDTDVDHGIRVIESVAVHMSRDWNWKERIIDTPQMLGVDDLGQNGITIRIWIKVQPLAQWDVAREFRRRLKIAFDQNGIRIPYAQQDIWFRNRLETKEQSLSREEGQALLQMVKDRISEINHTDSESSGSKMRN